MHVSSGHAIMSILTTLGQTCIASPPMWLVMSEPHFPIFVPTDLELHLEAVIDGSLPGYSFNVNA